MITNLGKFKNIVTNECYNIKLQNDKNNKSYFYICNRKKISISEAEFYKNHKRISTDYKIGIE